MHVEGEEEQKWGYRPRRRSAGIVFEERRVADQEGDFSCEGEIVRRRLLSLLRTGRECTGLLRVSGGEAGQSIKGVTDVDQLARSARSSSDIKYRRCVRLTSSSDAPSNTTTSMFGSLPRSRSRRQV